MEVKWCVLAVKVFTDGIKEWSAHLNICQGNSDIVLLDLQCCIRGKKAAESKMSCPSLNDHINNFELCQGWKLRIEQLQP